MPAKKGLLEKQIRAVLKSDERSRNSDIRLTQLIWWNFYRNKLTMLPDETWAVPMKNLFELPREDNIKRIRAKIQNVEHKFVPTDIKVAIKRGMQEQEWREYLGYESGDTL